MAIVRVGAHELFYEIYGAGDRPPVVLIMGLGMNSDAWARQLPVLAQQRRVLVFDNRGVGRSSKPPAPYTTAELADDAAGVMDAAGLAEAHIVGISLGGAIAQELVLRHPGRVRSVCLVATFAGLDDAMRATADAGAGASTNARGFDPAGLVRALGDGSLRIDPQAMIGFLLPLVFTPAFIEREREYMAAMWAKALSYGLSAEGFAGQVAAAMAHDTQTRLQSIRRPTLVVTGTQDRLVPPAQSRLLAAGIPGARLVEIEGATHGLTLERYEELNTILDGWLAEND